MLPSFSTFLQPLGYFLAQHPLECTMTMLSLLAGLRLMYQRDPRAMASIGFGWVVFMAGAGVLRHLLGPQALELYGLVAAFAVSLVVLTNTYV
jgi:hypothetical protein